jgi:hypothetical protein
MLKGSLRIPDDGSLQGKPQVYIRVSSLNGIYLLSAMSFGLLSVMVFFIIGFIYTKSIAVRRAIMANTHLKLLGFAFIYTSMYFYIGPPAKKTCNIRIWLQLMGYCLVMAPLSAKSVYLYSMNRFYSKFIVKPSQVRKIWASFGVTFLVILQVVIEAILLFLFTILVSNEAEKKIDRDSDELQIYYVCKSKSSQPESYKSAAIMSLFVFNFLILLVSSVFAFLNRKLSQQLTENSQILCMSINLYAFILRLPLLLDGTLIISTELSNASFIWGTALSTHYTICGAILTSSYYEYLESAKGKAVRVQFKKKIQKLQSKFQKSFSNMSTRSVLRHSEDNYILYSEDSDQDDFTQKISVSCQSMVGDFFLYT